MKNALIILLISLVASSCSDVKVNDIAFGNSLNKAKNCEALHAVETLINNPKIRNSKTQTGYPEILFENYNSIYWGNLKLDIFGDRIVNPLYKTNKNEYYEIMNKIYGINKPTVDNIISEWFNKNYYPCHIENVQTSCISKLIFAKNKEGYYNVKTSGIYKFYYSIMEKSNDQKIDSIMTNYTIKKFNYNCVIEKGKNLSNMILK